MTALPSGMSKAFSDLDAPAQEYCSMIRGYRNQQDLFDGIKSLCGFPGSSEETVALIEILQTEQTLLHAHLSANPGHPNLDQMSQITKLKTTTDLLSLMHKSTEAAGFPRKGLGFRKAFCDGCTKLH